MAKKFAEHNGLNLTQVNNEILEKWMKEDIFHRSIDEREGCPQFVFFEGPPSANGHPGIHHVLGRALKDTFNRYKTMQGFQVKRKAGWDTHGLPVELSVEKALDIKKTDIDNPASPKYISIEDYNRKCRENVMMYTKEWRDLTERMGYFVDLDHPYITYDNKYIETLWWLLKQFYQKGLLYKGYTIQPYSPAAGTGLSSHELNQPGCYRDVKDTTCTALFEIKEPRQEWTRWGKPCFVAWTTTPWTLPSNTALCVGPKIKYVAIETYNPYNAQPVTIIMAEALVGSYLKAEGRDLPLEDYKQGDKIVPWRQVGEYMGTDLLGIHYRQLMPWVKPCEKVDDELSAPYVLEFAKAHPEKVFTVGQDRFVEMEDCAFRVIPGDYVTTDDGTGIVHIAPTFGADDAKVARDAGIPSLFIINKQGETRPMVDLQGKYYVVDEAADAFVKHCMDVDLYAHHAGDYVKPGYEEHYEAEKHRDETDWKPKEDLNVVISLEMKMEDTAFKIEKHVHNYPHCWRTDQPVLYYPLDSWFIRSSAKKERMSELNKTIGWHPESTGSGRFGNWLDNLNDWNLSRSRFWGTPLPIWRNRETREEICIGSLEELYNEIEKAVKAGVMEKNPLKEKGFVPGDMSQENYDRIDLHRPYVDYITLVSESGKPMKRETDLIDVWFDSGSMPYAQLHYPFENRELVDDRKFYPADYINEGVDQTRGWFFTLHAIATMIFDSVAFKNVVSTGLVLDAKGNKMSKHVGNVVNPFEMIEKYGSDAVRFYMMTNSEPWDNLKFDPEGVDEVRRKFFGTLYNTYSFFALYANVDGYEPSASVASQLQTNAATPEIDRWILSCLNTLVKNVKAEMDNFDPTRAGRLIDAFVNDDLSNWYVRLNRKRFWGKDMDADKRSAYDTLYTCLMTVAKLLAPFAPFYADQLYRDLGGKKESVHLDDFPVADEKAIDTDLEARMAMAQKITSMVLALRRKVNIKVRQPLQSIMIPANEDQKKHIEAVKHLIMNEVNVKELKFVDGAGILVKKVKCNFRVMGKKFGKQMKAVAAAVDLLSQEQIAQLETDNHIDLNIDGTVATIEKEDVEIISEDIPGWLVANEGALTVALEVELTEELRNEGMARELINRIQNIRKDSGLEITDRIQVTVAQQDDVVNAVNAFADYIKTQVLADEINVADNDGQEVDFDEFKLNIKITKS